jgi:hypothetical protein
MTSGLSDEEQRAAVRAAVGGCLQVNVMPSGPTYIEAVCVWPDRSAYVLLCRRTRRLLRFTEAPRPPLCPQESPARGSRTSSSTTKGQVNTWPFGYSKENKK